MFHYKSSIAVILGVIFVLMFSSSHLAAAPRDSSVAKILGLQETEVNEIRTIRGTTNRFLSKMPSTLGKRLQQRLQYGELPRLRESFRQLTEVDESGHIPDGARVKALHDLDLLRMRKPLIKSSIAGLPVGATVSPTNLLRPFTAGIDERHWSSLGPDNVGGRTRALVIHPTSPRIMWAGSAGGGVWRTNDGGANWYPLDDHMANLAVSTIVIDQANQNTLYAGTGEGFFNNDSLRGGGIFRSLDGESWAVIPSTTTSDFQYVNKLAISADGKVLLAATSTGLFRSDNIDRNLWKKVSINDFNTVVFHPSDGQKAIAGTRTSGEAFYSNDGGETWRKAQSEEDWAGRIELTYCKHEPNTVYASVDVASGYVWRSKDGGKSFGKMATADIDGSHVGYLGTQGWYDNVIWAGDPLDPNIVIVGGIDLWISKDGGTTFTPISAWYNSPPSAHADHHVIVTHPYFDGRINRTLFFGNDGGIYKAADIYNTGQDQDHAMGWENLNHGYVVTQFYGAAASPTGVIVAGAQDNGTMTLDTNGWMTTFGGDGGFCAADQSATKHLYGEYVYLNIHQSDDGGRSAHYISGQYYNGSEWTWKPRPFTIPDAQYQRANFIAPFALDPNNDNVILAGGTSLWRTTNAKATNSLTSGPTWHSIKSPSGSIISTIGIGKGNSNVVWVGYNNGDVFTTSNGTMDQPTWKKVGGTPGNAMPSRFCTDIGLDPNSPNKAYVTFGGYSKNNIWKTSDRGTSWSNLGKSLPEVPIRTVVVNPQNSKYVYIGTEVGVFASEDEGLTWSPTNEGPTNCSVDKLIWAGDSLIAVTHGRGLFKIKIQ